jgi:hypothetical protein
MTAEFINVKALKDSISNNISAIKLAAGSKKISDDDAYIKFCEPINAAAKDSQTIFKKMIESLKSAKSTEQLKLDSSANDSHLLKSGIEYIILKKLRKEPQNTELQTAQETLKDIDYKHFLSKNFIPTVEVLDAVKLLTAKTPEAQKSFDKLIKKAGIVIDIYNETERLKSQPAEHDEHFVHQGVTEKTQNLKESEMPKKNATSGDNHPRKTTMTPPPQSLNDKYQEKIKGTPLHLLVIQCFSVEILIHQQQ